MTDTQLAASRKMYSALVAVWSSQGMGWHVGKDGRQWCNKCRCAPHADRSKVMHDSFCVQEAVFGAMEAYESSIIPKQEEQNAKQTT